MVLSSFEVSVYWKDMFYVPKSALQFSVSFGWMPLSHQAMGRFLCERAGQAALHEGPLHMVPAPQWDAELLRGDSLRNIGRTTVQEFTDCGKYCRVQVSGLCRNAFVAEHGFP